MSANRMTQFEKTYGDLRVIKRAHNYAMERKKRVRFILGWTSAAISVFVTSGVIELIWPGAGADPSRNAIVTIKIATAVAAVLTVALTMLNYEKEYINHQSALLVYSNLARRCGTILAQFKDGLTDPAVVDAKIDEINVAYNKANEDFNASTPSNRDYRRARADAAKPKTLNP